MRLLRLKSSDSCNSGCRRGKGRSYDNHDSYAGGHGDLEDLDGTAVTAV